MDRWIDIGQQIKDENWIARPLTGSRGNSGSTKQGPGGDELAGAIAEDDSLPGVGGSSSLATQRTRKMSQSFHPLQHHGSEPFLRDDPSPRPRREDRWMGDLTDSSTPSNDSERQINRERAARINQRMNASSKFPSVYLRGLRSESIKSGSSSPTRELSPITFGTESPIPRRIHRPSALSSLSRIMTLPLSSTELDTVLSSEGIPASEPTSAIPGHDRGRSSEGIPASEPTSAIPGHDRGRSSEGIPASEPTSAFPDHCRGLSIDNNDNGSIDLGPLSRRGTEDTDLRDVLAETNIAYHQGHHAIYHDQDPALAHREHRHFNSLQYNYDRRRSREDEAPESPEWHLTSVEVDQMEAQRSQPERTGNRDNDELTTPVPILSITGPPETLLDQEWSNEDPIPSTLSLFHPLAPPPLPPAQQEDETTQGALAPPALESFVPMSPMMIHLPPTFPKFCPPGQEENGLQEHGQVHMTEVFDTPQTPASQELLDRGSADPMVSTPIENSSNTGTAAQ
ncbi:hypothetical protein BGZ83_000082 [Gryganskiella cystojenkinii]|nr:hypothetical protein BGZ83_000082 [Gryganskiella cystojenkinii]